MNQRKQLDGLDNYRVELAEFCRRHHITKLSLFGSALGDDFRSDSDIDVLVEFQADVPVGLITLSAIERALSDLLGRTVDLRTPEELSPYIREEVTRSAVVQYAEQ
jgi:predicted nucleotidyltransferase